MSLKPQERLKIITEYVRSGKVREGYKITESKEGKYRVSVVRDEKDALVKKRAKLVKKLASLDKLIEERQANSTKEQPDVNSVDEAINEEAI